MSHGSRGRIQRRKSRLAALRVESLEERRLLSASRSAVHAAHAAKIDSADPLAASLTAEISGSIESNKHDTHVIAPGKPNKSLAASIEKLKSAGVGHAVGHDLGHGMLGEPPGAVVSSQAKTLSTIDRPSDGPSSGRGWALGHLISKSSHDKPDNPPSKPLPAMRSSLPTQIMPASRPEWSSSGGNKAAHAPRSIESKPEKAITPLTPSGTGQIIVAAPQFGWNDSLHPAKPIASNVSPKAILPPAKPTPVKIASTLPETSTSKMVVDEEGDKHNVLVKASSDKASWTVHTQTKPVVEIPAKPPNPPVQKTTGTKATGGRQDVDTPQERPRIGLASDSHSRPGASIGSQPNEHVSKSSSSQPVSKILGPGAPNNPASPPVTQGAQDNGGQVADTHEVNRSQAAIASQEEVKGAEATDEGQAPVAAPTPPDSAAPPSDSAADPQAFLKQPRSNAGQQALPLDVAAGAGDSEQLGCSEFELADNAQHAATAMAGLWATVATSDPGSLLAKACDALAENLPVDAAALDDALADLLDELEDLGNDLASSLAQAGVSPWIAAASLGAAAGTAHRRRQQRRAKRTLGTRAAVLQQFPELLGLVPRGDA